MGLRRRHGIADRTTRTLDRTGPRARPSSQSGTISEHRAQSRVLLLSQPRARQPALRGLRAPPRWFPRRPVAVSTKALQYKPVHADRDECNPGDRQANPPFARSDQKPNHEGDRSKRGCDPPDHPERPVHPRRVELEHVSPRRSAQLCPSVHDIALCTGRRVLTQVAAWTGVEPALVLPGMASHSGTPVRRTSPACAGPISVRPPRLVECRLALAVSAVRHASRCSVAGGKSTDGAGDAERDQQHRMRSLFSAAGVGCFGGGWPIRGMVPMSIQSTSSTILARSTSRCDRVYCPALRRRSRSSASLSSIRYLLVTTNKIHHYCYGSFKQPGAYVQERPLASR